VELVMQSKAPKVFSIMRRADTAYDRLVDAIFEGSLRTICLTARAAGRRGGAIRIGSTWAIHTVGATPTAAYAVAAATGFALQSLSSLYG
jgi:hypothetical protein